MSALSSEDIASLERSAAKSSLVLSLAAVVAAVIAIASLALGIRLDPRFFCGLVPVLLLLFTLSRVSGHRQRLKLLLRLGQDWATPVLEKERDIDAARMLFDSDPASSKTAAIDDQTCKDLNFDRLYAKVDRTYTDPGEAVLYSLMRSPLYSREALEERSRQISFLQDNPETRAQLQAALISLGHQSPRNGLFSLLWATALPRSRTRFLLTALAAAAVASVLIPFFFRSAALVIVPFVIFMLNLAVHYSIKRTKGLDNFSFSYLISCIKTASKLSRVRGGPIGARTRRLGELSEAVKCIRSKARFLFPIGPQVMDPIIGVFWEYFNIFLLLEIRAFFGTVDEISRLAPELRELYVELGNLDALQSIASYRASLPGYAEPLFTTKRIQLDVKDARQPLLDSPVPFSLRLDNNVAIVTGSNMAGKSTFLRTVAHSVLMAQTIATVEATEYRASFFRIITSISRTDDLVAGKSFYYVEAERILKALMNIEETVPTLCIMDELLSGTNSAERLEASESIVRYFARRNAVAIVATHDLELARRLDGLCDFYHFSGKASENGLTFDYLLKPGVATTKNAIALLRYLGYPKEITDGATEG